MSTPRKVIKYKEDGIIYLSKSKEKQLTKRKRRECNGIRK